MADSNKDKETNSFKEEPKKRKFNPLYLGPIFIGIIVVGILLSIIIGGFFL